LFGNAQSAPQETGDARQQLADFGHPSDSTFQLPGRTEAVREPFPHNRLAAVGEA
jgi:hypothetical protein